MQFKKNVPKTSYKYDFNGAELNCLGPIHHLQIKPFGLCHPTDQSTS